MSGWHRREMSFVVRKNVWKKLLPVVLLAVISIVIGATGAAVLHNLTLENPIKTPPVEGFIQEKLNGNAKEVNFINKGEADVFLRVAYGETWSYEDSDTQRTLLLPNMAGRKDGNGKYRVARPDWRPKGWLLDPESGWLYYHKVLKVGEATPLIVSKVDFADADALEELVEGEKYKEADYDLHFTIEVVQASDEKDVSVDAVKKLFQKDLGSMTAADGRIDKEADIQWPGTESWSPEDDSAKQ